MKIGVFGDIHGNLAALREVMAFMKKQSCDILLCTGDIVGYGPSPKECIEIISENGIPAVCGNHDKYVLDPSANLQINPDALDVIRWTASILPKEYIDFMSELPWRVEFEGIHIVHASHGTMSDWPYVINEEAIEDNFENQDVDISFNGHAHIPLLVQKQKNEPGELYFLHSGIIERGYKYIINVGSVGQPRDRDNRASCVVFDTITQSIRLKRLEYDREETIKLMKQHSLPKRLISRLELGR